jgi:hypothetical protein
MRSILALLCILFLSRQAMAATAVPLTEATAGIPTFKVLKMMPIPEQEKVVTSLKEALMAIEAEADERVYASDSRFQNILYFFNVVMLESAFANDKANCVFAGYAQQINSRGRCPRPKPVTDKCGTKQVECNPLLFGEGVCIDGPFAQATAKCQESPDALDARSIAENLKGEEKQKAWDDLRAQLLEYCKSPRPIDERACEVLAEKFAAHEEILAKIKAEEAERLAKEAAAKALEASMKYMYPKAASAEYCETHRKATTASDGTNVAPVAAQPPAPSPGNQSPSDPKPTPLPECVDQEKTTLKRFWTWLKFWDPQEKPLDTDGIGCSPKVEPTPANDATEENSEDKPRLDMSGALESGERCAVAVTQMKNPPKKTDVTSKDKNFNKKDAECWPSDNEAIRILALSITASAKTDEEKVYRIQNEIAARISYDMDRLCNPPGSEADRIADEVDVTFASGKSMCLGISRLFAELARSAGLRSRVIEGKLDNIDLIPIVADHAWNEVLVDEKFVPIDVTGNLYRGNCGPPANVGRPKSMDYYGNTKKFRDKHKTKEIRVY